MKKAIILAVWLLFLFLGRQLVLAQEGWFIEINNDTERCWLIKTNEIYIGVVGPFAIQKIKIERPTKKFQIELVGISDDRGFGQKRFFWPEDHIANKFIWKVEP